VKLQESEIVVEQKDLFDDWSDEDSLSECYEPEEDEDDIVKGDVYKSPIYQVNEVTYLSQAL